MNQALDILRNTFGFESFRPPQDQIINTVCSGGDALVLMPTGGGKSLCYQVPALVRDGCCIVISPLIALMQDQVSTLRQLGIKASFLNSTLDAAETFDIEQRLLSNQLDLLYIAPERLIQTRMLELLKQSKLSLFAIDEAHCVSQWGHDFRADYLQLDLLTEIFPDIPRIALTATADERTRQEIIQRLQLQDAEKFIAGFDRPNIQYRIGLKHTAKQQLLKFLNEEHPNDAGIIYCLSRKKTEDIAFWLQQQGFNALPYHAGLDSKTRADFQARFLREDNLIMVATIAFGMGIDKPDVRFVAHLDLPKTVEAYYQETGRAGRDGEPATAWMIYGLQDVIKLRQMMEQSQGSEEHKRAEQHRLNAMLGLCEIISCRRQALLNYFDESLEQPCGNCDNCLSPVDTWDGTEAAQMALSAAYRTGQRFGVNYLIDVLRGAQNEKITQNRHNELPIYGIGQDRDNNQWRSVFRQLVAQGYFRIDLDSFGALKLEEKCRPILRGEQTIQLRREVKTKTDKKKANKPSTKTALPSDIDVGLWEALRDHRRELAEEQGIPPYIIFHDSTLKEMCFVLPSNKIEFATLSGVGERKLEKYAEGFLQVINDFRS